jgi:hypothetical protein
MGHADDAERGGRVVFSGFAEDAGREDEKQRGSQ